jgi:hypothetical protein
LDTADPSPAVRAALLADSKDPKLSDWWRRAEPVLIQKRPRSTFAATKPATAPAAMKTKELARDDGRTAGRKSMAGNGHVVVFDAPAEGMLLTAVRIYGSRYGRPQPPAEDFHVWLCDADGKEIKDFPFPYKSFTRDTVRWVTLDTEPTEVPRRFMICVGFNPTQTKGVFVHHDPHPDGDSRTGLPGAINDAFAGGDWMIRAIVAEPPPTTKPAKP